MNLKNLRIKAQEIWKHWLFYVVDILASKSRDCFRIYGNVTEWHLVGR